MATIRRATVAVVFSTFAPSRTKSSTISGGSAVIAMETMTRRSCESDSLIDIGGGRRDYRRLPPMGRQGSSPVSDPFNYGPGKGAPGPLFIPTRPDLADARNKPDPTR
jgi:hypothetical protein